MPLLVVTGIITRKEFNMKSLAEKRKYKLINYKWDKRVKSEFIDSAKC
jgi:hypothetical protein